MQTRPILVRAFDPGFGFLLEFLLDALGVVQVELILDDPPAGTGSGPMQKYPAKSIDF